MGAWGARAFENDAALDWLAELRSEGVQETLTRVACTPADEYLDVDDGTSGLAAAEIVAATLPNGRSGLPNEAMAWLAANGGTIGAREVALARRAVERVLAERSELRELWDETGTETEWHVDVHSLLSQLISA
jgi:hypothetical protein